MKKNNRKSPKTRTAILDAACRVFAKNAYNAASIRTIAKEGGVPHALIRYYYPTKADLFEAVCERICRHLYDACTSAIDETNYMTREEGFSLYVSRLIEFSERQPWVFRIILLNLSVETEETLPGRSRFVEVVERIREKLSASLRLSASREEICRFTDSFNALAMYYLGAPDSAAWLLRLKPESRAYARWVHRTLVDIFLPNLDGLFKTPS